jgi:hypothetical protein
MHARLHTLEDHRYKFAAEYRRHTRQRHGQAAAEDRYTVELWQAMENYNNLRREWVTYVDVIGRGEATGESLPKYQQILQQGHRVSTPA